MPALPARPSRKHLRRAAKRLARERAVRLSVARHELAITYGFRTWPELVRHVDEVRARLDLTARLFAAVRSGDAAAVRRRLAEGANPRALRGRETALHLAARRGPLAAVEVLIAGGALEWQPDLGGWPALRVARASRSPDRDAIVALLDRSAIADTSFRAAVAAIHAGDLAALDALLVREPRLLRERAYGPDAYRMARRHQYFLDPKLFWFVANNPTLVDRMPPNIAEVAALMIRHGVERGDLDYALELTMSSGVAADQGRQRPLMLVMLAAGAVAGPKAIAVAAAHGQLGALRTLLEAGMPLDLPLAASLGDDDALPALTAAATPEARQLAFGLAVINGRLGGARTLLNAGADVDAYLPVHVHSTALHQAAAAGDVPMLDLLLARGARADVRDTLWGGTPLGWAQYAGNERARAVLAAHEPPP